MVGNIEQLEQRRTDLALAVVDGDGDVAELQAVEDELAEAVRWAEWEDAAGKARQRREAERRQDELETAARAKEARLRDAARNRLGAATRVEQHFSELADAIEDYVSCSDLLGDRARPVVWWLQWKLNNYFRSEFARPPAQLRVGLIEGERDRLKKWLTEEEADVH